MAVLTGIEPREFDSPSRTDAALGMSLELTDDEVLLGRGPDRVTVRLASPQVSKVHARITFTPKGYEIQDLNSRNGTFVNRRRLVAWHATRLAEGDEVIIAPFAFVFHQSAPDGQEEFLQP
jgi:pSer/pThr/pTyr-binding forkhead associated (FHA) protein